MAIAKKHLAQRLNSGRASTRRQRLRAARVVGWSCGLDCPGASRTPERAGRWQGACSLWAPRGEWVSQERACLWTRQV
jgi:hypothetical protein